jgi:DNA-binding MarR family transcriptional regulator
LVLRALLEAPGVTGSVLARKCKKDPYKIRNILEQLQKEGFIRKKKNTYSIA